MSLIVFTLILLGGAFCAGMLGSLTGLGGGVILIPLLTLGFGYDIRYAIGASLIASIATSSGAAAAYIREGITNIRIGMFLEIATTSGAIAGAVIAVLIPTHIVAIMFGLVLLFSSLMSLRKKVVHISTNSAFAEKLKLGSSYPSPEGVVNYGVKNVGGGYLIMTLAGILSGILGIGSGAVKVVAMDIMMRVPFKVSTTTSNFMVGITTATGAVVYLQRGYIQPGLALPVIIGVLAGSLLGTRILIRADVKWLRLLFSIVIGIMALEMIYNGMMGKV
ncbi:sulfite exporter TauE/SafE family protein [Sediminibacterium ginsengisoli]|uniref:Probable membrane transporter protein n=1 Tax=Sediminibacterium ginsengisoli TaxID=413434 RepID=A0A1T4JZH2_9BACT|nr:sulfite exporter TauE/SafE family protein [Sediminibacterium ginsengisoli]SJZ35435.1 hypothetical protein SAMN04488132_101329 [Sediminibacterium ginsengisoli]